MRTAIALLASLTIAAPAPAQSIEPGSLPRDVAAEVMRLHDAVGTLRVSGRFSLERDSALHKSVIVLNGPAVIAGRIVGDVVALNANVDFSEGAEIEGNLLVVGGSVSGREQARVGGTIRIYSQRVAVRIEGDRMVIGDGDQTASESNGWWRRRERWRDRSWGSIRLVSARTYNRVEGLPILIGPTFGRELDWGRLSVDALGIIRSADSFEWNSRNLGHLFKTELQLGRRGGLRIGGRLFDIVESVEPWQFSDTEVGLASFFLHRDYRDYFNVHGRSLTATLFAHHTFELGLAYSHERWGARDTRDPWTLFRDTQSWRFNPATDEGRLHILNASFRFDTRTDERNPWSGWYFQTEYERGSGVIEAFAAASGGPRPTAGHQRYDRLFVDLRRYNRVSPDAQLNLRVVMGGWISGDPLPLQRRFSLGGPATMPGFDFRRLHADRNTSSAVDYWACGQPGPSGPLPAGTPAQCERFALAQVEFRGDIDIDPFGILDGDRSWRRGGWGRGAQWVVFADAGRGWLVGDPDGRMRYRKSVIPGLSTFQTDVGLGLMLDDVGVYVAKAISQSNAPVNFFVRLRPRF